MDKQKLIDSANKHVQAGRFDKAISDYQKILDADPRDLRTQQKMGELHARAGNPDLAARFLVPVAVQLAKDGFGQKAAALLKQVLAMTPEQVDLHGRLATIYEQMGLRSEAMAQLETWVRHHAAEDEAREPIFVRMMDLSPDRLDVRLALAKLRVALGDAVGASTVLRDTMALLRQARKQEELVKVGELLLQQEPNDRAVAREVVGIYLAMGDIKRALPRLLKIQSTAPEDVRLLTQLAQVLHQQGQTEKAVAVLKHQAKLAEKLGSADAERNAWEEIKRIDPGHAEALRRLAPVLAPMVRPPTPLAQRKVTPQPVASADDDEPTPSLPLKPKPGNKADIGAIVPSGRPRGRSGASKRTRSGQMPAAKAPAPKAPEKPLPQPQRAPPQGPAERTVKLADIPVVKAAPPRHTPPPMPPRPVPERTVKDMPTPQLSAFDRRAEPPRREPEAEPERGLAVDPELDALFDDDFGDERLLADEDSASGRTPVRKQGAAPGFDDFDPFDDDREDSQPEVTPVAALADRTVMAPMPAPPTRARPRPEPEPEPELDSSLDDEFDRAPQGDEDDEHDDTDGPPLDPFEVVIQQSERRKAAKEAAKEAAEAEREAQAAREAREAQQREARARDEARPTTKPTRAAKLARASKPARLSDDEDVESTDIFQITPGAAASDGRQPVGVSVYAPSRVSPGKPFVLKVCIQPGADGGSGILETSLALDEAVHVEVLLPGARLPRPRHSLTFEGDTGWLEFQAVLGPSDTAISGEVRLGQSGAGLGRVRFTLRVRPGLTGQPELVRVGEAEPA
jgi:tetratricopeptide (TPR) repeat protein